MKAEEFIVQSETYIIPVTWGIRSTIAIKGAKNLADAIEYAKKYAKNHRDDIPLGRGEYINGSYKIEINDDDEAINAQSFSDIGGILININD